MSTLEPDPPADLRAGFALAEWDVHPLQGVLEQAGQRMHVEPKVMDVLLCLARHAGQVVTRDMLLTEVWKGVVVTDDVVTRCISELRTVLRDTGRDRRFIRTIPKRGYSLLAPVTALTPRPPVRAESTIVVTPPPAELVEVEPAPWSAQWALDKSIDAARVTVRTTGNLLRAMMIGAVSFVAVIVILAVVLSDDDTPIKIMIDDDSTSSGGSPAVGEPVAATNRIGSIAVLPLANLSGNPEHEYFSDGLAEDIRNALIQESDLRVAARTSSVAFRDRPMDVREIARQLNVEALLEGTVRITDERLRVTTQLTDGKSGYPVWAESFERPVSDKLSLQAEVAAAILKRVTPSVNGGPARLVGTTANEQAHEAYLLGRYYWNQRTAESIERSIGYFEQALARDPDYALAYSGLADAWMLLANYADRPVADVVPKALDYTRKALALDAQLAEAHASLGMVQRQQGDLEAARASYQKAVELQPGYSMGQMWLGTLLLGTGDARGAAERFRTALTLDPLHPAVQTNYVSSLLVAGEFDTAREEAQRLLSLSPTRQMQKMRWAVSLEQGRFDEVLSLAVSQTPDAQAEPYLNEAVIEALLYLGRFDEAERAIRDNADNVKRYQRLMWQASLAVARRNAAGLRSTAEQLLAPEGLVDLPIEYRGCARQEAEAWLGVADLLDGRLEPASQRFRGVVADVTPTLCEENAPVVRSIARAYALEVEARRGAPDLAQQAAVARRDIADWRTRGWNNAALGLADVAILIIGGDVTGADDRLRELRRKGLQPYGRMRASPLFDRLWNLAPLNSGQEPMLEEYAAGRQRAAKLTLAKLGL
jgi:TolB-like protein/DNA-binding winged helix-turn-helix (wHTH) protein/Flp pilus assembly protein TadD